MPKNMTNIAELLKDAPKGMKLYSPLFGEVEFVRIDKQSSYPIDVKDCKGNGESFTEFGVYFAEHPDAECLLFPSKDCRTWEGWKLSIEPKFKVGDWIVQNDNGTVSQITKVINGTDEYGEYRAYEHTNGYFAACFEDEFHLWTIADAKDGDVLVTTKIRSCPFIYRKTSYKNNLTYYYAGIDGNGNFSEGCIKRTICHFGSASDVVPATKEQRDSLFRKMKEAGYQWDADKKELKKISKHYDIANFQPFDKVLCRNHNDDRWRADYFSHLHKNGKFFVGIGYTWCQCIPFNEETKHLLGTTKPCSEEYINW